MPTRINERSWAIEVIVEINRVATSTQRAVRRAGGERTVSAGNTSLFPDVLLFSSGTTLIQGWELKMPDTPITDGELISNAVKKARLLGLNSFLLWNVTTAVLYIEADGEFAPRLEWSQLAHITRRTDVEAKRAEWIAALEIIVRDLNDFFERGELRARALSETFSHAALADLILENAGSVAENLQNSAARKARFRAEVAQWWRTAKAEHPGENQWTVLARTALLGWINKLIFAHVLKTTHAAAAAVERIADGVSPNDAAAIFSQISTQCNFWSIFAPKSGEAEIPAAAWSQLVQLNGFLAAWQWENIPQETLQAVLQNTVDLSKRKIAGQYATPPALADLLARIAIEDTAAPFHDPFCGTGTIARAAYNLKRENGQTPADAMQSVWASDKFSYPLQIAALALSEPLNRGEVLHVFQADAFGLQPSQTLSFQDPNSGQSVAAALPQFPYIASNLPFVPFEERDAGSPFKGSTPGLVSGAYEGAAISAKADYYAFIPFALWPLLTSDGRLGLIISNAWLGANWGADFRKLLGHFYHLETVVTSGKGRWFQNAQVVTNILVLRKRAAIAAPADEEVTAFVTLRRSLEELQGEAAEETASAITLRDDSSGDIAVREYSRAQMRGFEQTIQWSAFFADLDWLERAQDKLVPASQIFEINRGERRGWDAMFYPPQNSGIEAEYLKPVLKSSSDIGDLIADADGVAFCCARSIQELQALKHNGALRWIRRFEHAANGTGKPLPEVLHRAQLHWYQMSDATLADLVTSLNPEQRIFVAKMRSRSFVNQRLVRFSLRDATFDADLCHALLNSIIGVFFLEALGFGRGLGVLDLNSTKLKNRLPILNPSLLSRTQSSEIKKLFAPLLKRPIENIADEMQRADRRAFDDAVLNAFGLHAGKENIRSAFRTLYEIRLAAKH